MSFLPHLCVVDTNVPKTANLALAPEIPKELMPCVQACVDAVDHVVKTRGLVLDAGDEIFTEYRTQLSMKGAPGVGDFFMKWAHDHRWTLPDTNRVAITKSGESYEEFPDDADLSGFDYSDRKFVAVSNSHPEKPPILQATDSKWWGWRDALERVGIHAEFLCSDYVQTKYTQKIGS